MSSLVCPVGPENNLLSEPSQEHCKRLNVRHPVLTLQEMSTLKDGNNNNNNGINSSSFNCAVIDCTFDAASGPDGMLHALERICDEAADAIQGEFGEDGVKGVILSDKMAGPDRTPLPSLLSVGAVHQHLLKTKQRPKVS